MSKETKLNLTPEQLKAITAPLEPALVIAGAGTGKTSVMAERVLWLVSEAGIDPAEILGLTFTNKAAQELRIRVRETLNKVDKFQSSFDLVEPNVSTYHAFAMQILNDHGLLIGVESDLKPVTETTRASLAFKTVLNTKLSLSHLDKSPRYIAKQLLMLDNQLAENNTSFVLDNITYKFIDTKSNTLNGEVKLKILDKGYIVDKEYKKLANMSNQYPSYGSNNNNIYHIKAL